MKKYIILFLIILLTAILLSYYFLKDFNSIDSCLDAGGSWNSELKKCKVDEESDIANHLWTTKVDGLAIQVPETKAVATLNEVVSLKDVDYFKGDYINDHDSKAIERGSVYFDNHKITLISKVQAVKNAENISYYAAPFMVSNQGSGMFSYVGLFSYNKHLKKSTHLDDFLLGDRVKSIQITDEIQAINISFMSYGIDQSFSEEPSLKKSINLLVGEDAFKPYKTMHSSWDKNQDGMNDCENDGSCDHTVDYSLPRNN